MNPNYSQKSCIFMGALPASTFFFMRLENAFLLTEKGALIEVVSDVDNLKMTLLCGVLLRVRSLSKSVQ